MKVFKLLTLIILATFLMGNTSCENQKADVGSNPGKYIDAGTGIYKQVKDTDTSGSTLEVIKNSLDTAQGVATTLNFVPGAQAILTPINMGLGLITTVLGIFVAREKKKVKIHEGRSNNYREAIEAGINNGDNQKVVEVEVMKKVLNKDTKGHFNGEGVALL